MNKSSQFSTLKYNLSSDQRNSININNFNPQIQNETKNSQTRDKYQKNFNTTDPKFFKNRTMSIKAFNKSNPNFKIMSNKQTSQMEHQIKFLSHNRISEHSIENENKQTNEQQEGVKNDIIQDKKEIKKILDNKDKMNINENLINYSSNCLNNNIEYEICEDINNKVVKNNFQKFKITNPKYNLNSKDINIKKDKIKNITLINNLNNFNQIHLNNPKIKIKLPNEMTNKIMNSNEYLSNSKVNTISFPFNDNIGKYININIENKITNYYNITNPPGNIEEKIKIKKNFTEEEINQKLNIYRTKLNSEMLKFLNQEKMKENERQTLYDNLKDNKEKFDFEKIVSKERLESSEKIVKMNQ